MLFADRIYLQETKALDGDEGESKIESSSQESGEQMDLMEEMSFLGPLLGDDSQSRSSIASIPSVDIAKTFLRHYQKEYRQLYKRRTSTENRMRNYTLKKKYDANPMTYWGDAQAVAIYDEQLVQFATQVHSVRPASASPERTFSHMKYLVSARRSSITARNTDMRLTVASLLPQKRKLEEEMKYRSLKRAMLFKNQQ